MFWIFENDDKSRTELKCSNFSNWSSINGELEVEQQLDPQKKRFVYRAWSCRTHGCDKCELQRQNATLRQNRFVYFSRPTNQPLLDTGGPKIHNKWLRMKAEEKRFSHLYQTQRNTSLIGSSRFRAFLGPVDVKTCCIWPDRPALLVNQKSGKKKGIPSQEDMIGIWGRHCGFRDIPSSCKLGAPVRYLFASDEHNLQELGMSRKPQCLPQIPSWPKTPTVEKTVIGWGICIQ